MSSTLQPVIQTGPIPARSLRSALVGPMTALRRRLSARKTRLALSALDDQVLADIGLKRSDIRDVCSRF